ncbi:hypothetical protein [Nocardia sp. NPDC127526]|uniref:hypothetical protein n=1 Tax=Nocardia sp. NPDC127526 TaxID=3345393 RepID=UPI003629A9AE
MSITVQLRCWWQSSRLSDSLGLSESGGWELVDPVSLGIAAAALLASKFGERISEQAATSSWHAIGQLRELIARKFGRDPEIPRALAELERNPTLENQVAAAEVIDGAVRTDPSFAAALQQLVDSARQDTSIDVFVANAYDQARQVNIRGDNTGTINLS